MKFKISYKAGGKKGNKAVSPAISSVIIAAATLVLVLVAGNYAYQVLERQRGASEFDAVKKSFITFDDAVRDVSFDKLGVRSARFTVNYGIMEVIPADESRGLPLSVTINEYSDASYNGYTGYVRYNLSIDYVNLGAGYKAYLFGDNKTVISEASKSSGTALIEQRYKWVSLTLYYRVKLLGTRVVPISGYIVNYVDIFIIKLTATRWTGLVGDFDLLARN
ncbi:MAG: hypothetical protein QXK26_02205, partial [Candidatus Bathyarchaeia archaeon]